MAWYSRYHMRRATIAVFVLLSVGYLLPRQKWRLYRADSIDGVYRDFSTNASNSTDDCELRYGTSYLKAFNKTATEYCEPSSNSSLVCFSNNVIDQRTDSFCVGGPASIYAQWNSIGLDCPLREWNSTTEETDVPQLYQLPTYWYNTGPQAILTQHVKLDDSSPSSDNPGNQVKPFMFLIKREGNHKNLWHTMMEIMSLTLTLDALRTMVDPETGKLFLTDNDMAHSRVVLLDDYDDGPFYDLWAMTSGLPTMRLRNVTETGSANIVIPLPGGSNPFWSADWVDLPCGDSALLHMFSQRVLDFYGIHREIRFPWTASRPLNILIIDREQSRRLLHQDSHVAALQTQYPDINIQLVDLAELTFAEQLRLVQQTDILVGVHGAGLTHGMFMAPNSTVVEIQPPELDHRGFGNMAKFLGHRYLRRHGIANEEPTSEGEGERDWHYEDVDIGQDEFMQVMQEAIEVSRR